MIGSELKLSLYLRASIFILGIIAFLAFIFLAQAILIPLVIALIISILINPIVNLFLRIKINRVIAILITLVIISLFIMGIGALLTWQISSLTESWPSFVEKLMFKVNQSIVSISNYFDIDKSYIYEWISNSKKQVIDNNGLAIAQKILSLGNIFISIFLIPVYVFFILYYKTHLHKFIFLLVPKNNIDKVTEIISEIKIVVQRYLTGLIIDLFIVAVLNSLGLLILGIDYAILLGILGAFLNLIPYIGGIIAVVLPMIIALATKTTPMFALYVLALYSVVQFIDNYIIVPKIVASKVKINAFFSILVVIVGNALWGIPGMFLSVPLLAILKLIFDRIEGLKPWGFLLGDSTDNFLSKKLKKS